MESCIAVDVGGTKMLVAEVSLDGQILGLSRYPTGRRTQRELVKIMIDGVEDFEKTVGYQAGRDEEHPMGIRPTRMGIGVVGRLDSVHGIWKKIEDGFSDEEIPLSAIMKERFGVECRIDNDVKSATIAEHCFGHAKGEKNYTYINVGTGLAAGMVVDGHLLRGWENEAGEVGYTNFTGGRGTNTENRTSGIGLHRHLSWILREDLLEEACLELDLTPDQWRSLHERMKKTRTAEEFYALTGEDRVGGGRLIELAQQGDELAFFLLDRLSKTVALLIKNLSWTISMDLVILGGGLMSSQWLMDRIKEDLDPYIWNRLPGGIRPSSLDANYVGILGAAAIAFDQEL